MKLTFVFINILIMQQPPTPEQKKAGITDLILGGLTFAGVTVLGEKAMESWNLQRALQEPVANMPNPLSCLEQLNLNATRLSLMSRETGLRDAIPIAKLTETTGIEEFTTFTQAFGKHYHQHAEALIEQIRDKTASMPETKEYLETMLDLPDNKTEVIAHNLNRIFHNDMKLPETMSFSTNPEDYGLEELASRFTSCNEVAQQQQNIINQVWERAQSLNPLQSVGVVVVAAVAAAAVVYGVQKLRESASQNHQETPSAHISSVVHERAGTLAQPLQHQVS